MTEPITWTTPRLVSLESGAGDAQISNYAVPTNDGTSQQYGPKS